MIENKKLYLNFPRFGLCNKLLCWANAFVWCKRNNAELVVSGWTHIPIGSILRAEKSLRWYRNFFNNERGNWFNKIFFYKAKVISSIEEVSLDSHKLYKYEATPYISDLPKLSPYREEIKSEFFKMIKRKHLRTFEEIAPPVIGLHIRRGDFLKSGSQTDLSYYSELVERLREISGSELPVTIFTDGYPDELTEVLRLPKVKLFDSVNDLVDLLVLSSSKVLVTTVGSSYSYWAAFISEGVVLHHPTTWIEQCRPQHINKKKFEGKYTSKNPPQKLIKNIEALSLKFASVQ